MKILALILAMQAGASPQADQQAAISSPPPFEVGERLDFAVKLGLLRVGSAAMVVNAVDTVRGVETFHFQYILHGGVPGYRMYDTLQSWTGTEDMVSRRFTKQLHEGSWHNDQVIEIFPDSGFYTVNGQERRATPVSPLDDAGFFYFVRGIPLEVGQTYRLNRYFVDDKNPMVIKVTKREEMELPDGTKIQCLVLEPVMGEKGLLSERAEGKIWLTDDHRRIPVQVRSRQPFGTLTLKLESITPGNSAP